MNTPQQMTRWLEKEGGLSQPEIARLVGCTQASIWRISQGKQQPKYELGSAIEALYTKTRQERKDSAA